MSEEVFLSEELRIKSEELFLIEKVFLSEEVRIKSEEFLNWPIGN